MFSLPTVYHEPKGIPVLEAWANGIPVVQPAHGAFPEMVQRTSGGILVTPEDPHALAEVSALTCNHAVRAGARLAALTHPSPGISAVPLQRISSLCRIVHDARLIDRILRGGFSPG